MSPRQWLPLIGITICVFIFNMSEFMPIGLLTDIATDFSVSESTAGMIISIYAWAVAILSLPIMLLLRKMEYRRMLLMCVGLFAFFQVLSGISSSYWMLVVSRLGVAVAHSVFWSIASPLAVKVVAPELQKLAISMVAAGTSIAMIAGLPLGRIIGLAMGWRMSFVTIAVVSVMALVLLMVVFPKVENPGTFTLGRLPGLFRIKVLVGIYVVVAVFVTGYYTGYSYIEPFMMQIAGLSESMTTVALTVFGLAGIVGSMVFTKYYDRSRFGFIILALGGLCTCLFMLRISATAMIAVMVVCALWGFFATMFNVSFQNEAIRASPYDATAIAMSMFSGIYNVGIAMGSLIGGTVTEMMSVGMIGYVGGVFTLVAVVFTMVYLIKHMKENDEERRMRLEGL
ncbi:MAG: MFS transporter [Candidatus Methanomethylophilaceae archaeon]|nr:MFS transporter [Candidatus Methanomethylophilaceae archaeon]